MKEKQKHENDKNNEEDVEVVEDIIEENDQPESSKEEKLEKELKESNEKYLRLVAEYDNYRKRTSKEKDAIYPQAQVDVISKFLNVLDNFERALEFQAGSEEYAKGIEMITKSFHDTLSSLGVVEVGKIGEPFDPLLHNAVMHIEDPSLGENVISKVLQKGYRMGDRIIRHATVETAN